MSSTRAHAAPSFNPDAVARMIIQDEEFKGFRRKAERYGADGALDLGGIAHLHGYSILGAGNFSIVLDVDGYAMKFSIKAHDAWMAYALWVREEPRGPHAPTIFHLGSFHGVQYAVMPKYEPERSDTAAWCIADALRGEGDGSALARYIREVLRFFEGVARIDLHSHNYMYDPVLGCTVITDPVSFTKSYPGNPEEF